MADELSKYGKHRSRTYGDVPSIEEIEAGFDREHISEFTYSLRGEDAETADELGIDAEGKLTPQQFHALVTKLSEEWNEGNDDAGNIASSMLSAIGFEWI